MANSIINYGTIAAVSIPTDVQPDLVKLEPSKPVDMLSEREREVLSLIGNGATNREIAEKLFISEHTVKSHIRSILNKLNISNRQQAAVYAERAGLIIEPDIPKSDS
jgi:DNA-binding NarL/FixJ family response regulator